MHTIIETHAHIYDEQFALDQKEMLTNAKSVGISQIWMPNCNSETILPMMALAKEYPKFCLPMIGLHPCYINADFEKEIQIIKDFLKENKVLAIGEIGLDLFWDKTFIEQQKEAFLIQCELAIEHNLWIDIHSRNAFWETIELIEKVNNKKLLGIFHCFSGTIDEAQKAISLGFKLGIGGVVTFKNGGIDKILPEIGLENILLETDAPYLAPVPFRGKRNEPSYLKYIAQKVADIFEIDIDKVLEKTTENALKFSNGYVTKFEINI